MAPDAGSVRHGAHLAMRLAIRHAVLHLDGPNSISLGPTSIDEQARANEPIESPTNNLDWLPDPRCPLVRREALGPTMAEVLYEIVKAL